MVDQSHIKEMENMYSELEKEIIRCSFYYIKYISDFDDTYNFINSEKFLTYEEYIKKTNKKYKETYKNKNGEVKERERSANIPFKMDSDLLYVINIIIMNLYMDINSYLSDMSIDIRSFNVNKCLKDINDNGDMSMTLIPFTGELNNILGIFNLNINVFITIAKHELSKNNYDAEYVIANGDIKIINTFCVKQFNILIESYIRFVVYNIEKNKRVLYNYKSFIRFIHFKHTSRINEFLYNINQNYIVNNDSDKDDKNDKDDKDDKNANNAKSNSRSDNKANSNANSKANGNANSKANGKSNNK